MTEIEDMDKDEIKKTVKISYDGRQTMIRIPKEISDFYALKKGDLVELTIEIVPEERENRKIPMVFRIVES